VTGRVVLPGGEDTIAAVATARGRGAIAVLRVSGPAARAVGSAVLEPFYWEPGRAHLAALRAPNDHLLVDRVVVTPFGAPRSFTGEDMIEIATHGGHVVPALALAALLAAGAREALPGEFTRRAVANGKLDLLQAEAIGDLVEAQSPAMHRIALRQLDGGLTTRISALREAALGLEALLAYDIDFPEEDDGPVPRVRIRGAADELLSALETLLATARAGEVVREGAVIVLAGAPNSGKSSLFNALIGASRAIVTDLPGTTRDALEALVEIDGWPVRLVDTAGLRDDAETVERLGIEVAARYIAGADAVLVCGDTSESLREARNRVARLTPGRQIAVRTKIDLVAGRVETTDRAVTRDGKLVADGIYIPGEAPPAAVSAVSAVTGEGLDGLAAAVGTALRAAHPEADGAGALLTRERHRAAVARARDEIRLFRGAWEAGALPAPVAAVHLRAAVGALEELIGLVRPDEVLDRLFRTFCVGK
jgi:tRNA modification GTPase